MNAARHARQGKLGSVLGSVLPGYWLSEVCPTAACGHHPRLPTHCICAGATGTSRTGGLQQASVAAVGPVLIPCSHCQAPKQADMLRQCHSCLDVFCSVCSTIVYDARDEHVACLECSAAVVRMPVPEPDTECVMSCMACVHAWMHGCMCLSVCMLHGVLFACMHACVRDMHVHIIRSAYMYTCMQARMHIYVLPT